MSERIKDLREIPGFPGYFISLEARVYSAGRGELFELRQGANRKGYLRVGLRKDKKSRSMTVHTLMLLTFVGPRPTGPEGAIIRHLDGNNKNNSISNLAYGTHRENYLDTVRHNRFPNGLRGNNKSRLTLDQVTEIRKLLSDNELTQLAIAKLYNVSESSICSIKRGHSWKPIEPMLNDPEYLKTLRIN